MWTPSKAPIATCRGRRSTSSSLVTWMLIRSGSLSLSARRQPVQRLGQGHERLRLLDPKRPDGGSAQALAVGVPQPRDQAADVGARRALDFEFSSLAAPPSLLEAVDRDLALGQLYVLAPPGEPVRPHAP